MKSVRKLRRANSMTSVEAQLMMAAGESRTTDPKKFVKKQSQMLREFEGKNLHASSNPENSRRETLGKFETLELFNS